MQVRSLLRDLTAASQPAPQHQQHLDIADFSHPAYKEVHARCCKDRDFSSPKHKDARLNIGDTPQAGLPAAVAALLADPSEQCRLAALQLLSTSLPPEWRPLSLPPEWRPLSLLIPAIAARFGCSVGNDSESRLPADSSEDVRLAAVILLRRLLMSVADSNCNEICTDMLSLVKQIRAERLHSEISAEEVRNIVFTVQRAMGDTWVDVRKVCAPMHLGADCCDMINTPPMQQVADRSH